MLSERTAGIRVALGATVWPLPLGPEGIRERYLARLRAYRADHLEELRAKNRAYRRENREEIELRRRERVAAESPEERQRRLAQEGANKRRYAARNVKAIAAKNQRWSLQRDPELRRKQQRDWKARNRERVAADNHRRRAGAHLTRDDAHYMAVLHFDPCSYCGGLAGEIDHIEPLARDGGVEWLNLTSACRSCNAAKHTRRLLVHMLRK